MTGEYTADQLDAAKARVPFAFGIAPPPGAAGGLVHDWQRCAECRRLRLEALGFSAPDTARITQP